MWCNENFEFDNNFQFLLDSENESAKKFVSERLRSSSNQMPLCFLFNDTVVAIVESFESPSMCNSWYEEIYHREIYIHGASFIVPNVFFLCKRRIHFLVRDKRMGLVYIYKFSVNPSFLGRHNEPPGTEILRCVKLYMCIFDMRVCVACVCVKCCWWCVKIFQAFQPFPYIFSQQQTIFLFWHPFILWSYQSHQRLSPSYPFFSLINVLRNSLLTGYRKWEKRGWFFHVIRCWITMGW